MQMIYAPVAPVMPPVVFVTLHQFNLLFQFGLYTRPIERFGPLEWIFPTPSHHCVHHGSIVFSRRHLYRRLLFIVSGFKSLQQIPDGHELRRRADHLGPTVWHVPGENHRKDRGMVDPNILFDACDNGCDEPPYSRQRSVADIQTFYYGSLWRRLLTIDNWKSKLEVVIKGPSRTPDSPWSGWEHFKVNVSVAVISKPPRVRAERSTSIHRFLVDVDSSCR